MGKGNYWLRDADTAYVDLWDVYQGADEDSDHSEYEVFVRFLANLLPSIYRHRYAERIWLDRERLLIADTSMYRISLVEWETYFAINVELSPEMVSSTAARQGLYRESTRLFDALSEAFELRVRCSGWTTLPYKLGLHSVA